MQCYPDIPDPYKSSRPVIGKIQGKCWGNSRDTMYLLKTLLRG